MNGSELAAALYEQTRLSRKDASWFVNAFFDAIEEGVQRDGRVELRGFGVFRVHERNQAGFQNPKNGRYYGGGKLKTVRFQPSNAGAPISDAD